MQRRGKFWVSHDFQNAQSVLDSLFEWLEFTPVLTTEHKNFTEYIGLSKQFEECPAYETPLYNLSGGYDEFSGKWFKAERVT